MNGYVDFRFYESVYKGTLEQGDFDKQVVKASAHVRSITFGRADTYTDDDAVKLATCAVCDVISEDSKRRLLHKGMNVSSENTDGYSVSYVTEQNSGETVEELLERKVYKAAEVFLSPTGLLYLGV